MLLLGKNKTILFISILLLLFIPAVFSLLHPGFFLSDDGNWMVIRFSAFYDALRSGQFPVRFLPRLNYQYGYPVADFLYPLFMYIGVPIHVIGINFVTTIKIIFGISIIGSGLATFFWLRKIITSVSAVIGSLIYVYFPYHLFDIYQRGSIGEVLALALVPFILWQIERRKIIYTSLGISFLILAHNSLAVLFLPFLLGYMFIQKSFSMKNIGLILLFSLGSSAFFWIPALYDKQFTIFDRTLVSNLQSYFINNSTRYLLGWITDIVVLLSFFFLFIKRKIIAVYFFIILLFSLFMALPISSTIWQVTQIGPYFQFPYRFLSLTIVSVSFLGAISFSVFPKRIQFAVSVLLIIILFFSSWNLLFPKIFQYFPDSYFSTNQNSTTVKNEYMPKWVKIVPAQQPPEKAYVQNKKGSIQIVQERGTKLNLVVISPTDTTLVINTIDYPGWLAKVDNQKVGISHTNSHGTIELAIPQGSHSVQLFFTETPLRIIADLVSIVSLVLLGFLFFKKPYER